MNFVKQQIATKSHHTIPDQGEHLNDQHYKWYSTCLSAICTHNYYYYSWCLSVTQSSPFL